MPQASVPSLFEQALAHHRAGEFQQAELVYRQVIQQEPNHAQALHLLAILLFQFGHHDPAMELVQRAISVNASTPEYHNTLGEIYRVKRFPAEAEAAYRRAIELQPSDGSFYSNLSLVLRDQRRLAEAIAAGTKAVELAPNLSAAHLNLANALSDSGQIDAAIVHYEQAARIDPNDSRIPTAQGATLMEVGRLDEALQSFDRAIALDNSADAHHNRSFIRLLRGDFQRGWNELEWRWQTSDSQSLCISTNRPLWDGSNIAGKTLLLFAEQGAGDAIQFIRYAPKVAPKSGAKVIVICRSALKSLLRGVEGVSQVLTPDQPLPPFDYFLPILSLPRVFGTTERDIPADIPYIPIDANLVQKWNHRLGTGPGRRIGLAWQGRPTHVNDRNRSIALSRFAPFASVRNIRWISLQKGPGAEQAKQAPSGMEILDLSEEIDDFSDTAALIANLDLVIAVDTSAVHLAGAMGKPVWALLPFCPDWRWMLHRKDSPWYPSARLLRQPAPGDWDSVLAEAARMLEQM